MSEIIKLLPCPFCGASAHKTPNMGYISCSNHRCLGEAFDEEAWNTRAKKGNNLIELTPQAFNRWLLNFMGENDIYFQNNGRMHEDVVGMMTQSACKTFGVIGNGSFEVPEAINAFLQKYLELPEANFSQCMQEIVRLKNLDRMFNDAKRELKEGK